jgi:L-ascorbate oxidase
MTCEYNWTLEYYSTMSRACYNCPNNLTDCARENCIAADGIERAVESVNRLIPGPSIQVCKNDVVIVNLENSLRSQRVTSIHWHGIKQKGTPFMDGVSQITQCPIAPNTKFQYK